MKFLIEKLKSFNSFLCINQSYKNKYHYIVSFVLKYKSIFFYNCINGKLVYNYIDTWYSIYKNINNTGFWIIVDKGDLNIQMLKNNIDYIVKNNKYLITSDCFLNNICNATMVSIFLILNTIEEYYSYYNYDLFKYGYTDSSYLNKGKYQFGLNTEIDEYETMWFKVFNKRNTKKTKHITNNENIYSESEMAGLELELEYNNSEYSDLD